MNNEFWKDIPGFEGIYAASTQGRVRSLKRIAIRSDGRTQKVPGRILKQQKNDNNYLCVRLSKNKSSKIYRVHRIVLITFVDVFCLKGFLDACHNDGDKQNNFLDNLRWDTRRNNHADKIKHGTHVYGSRSTLSKLTEEEVAEMRRLVTLGLKTQKELVEMFGVTKSNVSAIIRRKTWKHVK